MRLLHAILSDVKENIHNLVFQDYHLIRKNHLYFRNRLNSKENYNFLISQKEEKLHQGYIVKRGSTIAFLTGKISSY